MAKAKPANTDPLSPGRHFGDGTRCGYEVMSDGKVLLAPSVRDRFLEFSARKAGFNQMLEAVSRLTAMELGMIARQQDDLFNRLFVDFGLTRGGGKTITIDHAAQIAVISDTPPSEDKNQ